MKDKLGKVIKSAVSGRFVSKDYAKKQGSHTTYRQTVRLMKGGGRGK